MMFAHKELIPQPVDVIKRGTQSAKMGWQPRDRRTYNAPAPNPSYAER